MFVLESSLMLAEVAGKEISPAVGAHCWAAAAGSRLFAGTCTRAGGNG